MAAAELLAAFKAACSAVWPQKLVKQALERSGDEVTIGGRRLSLHRNVYVAAFGKAAAGMSVAAATILDDHLVRAIASVPADSLSSHTAAVVGFGGRLELYEGARGNVADSKAAETARRVEEMATALCKGDIFLVLISGGGSALLPAPIDGITLDEKVAVIKSLSCAGASIGQLNAVRTALSRLKGGRLAALAEPAHVVALLISDVIGDPPHLIASGPTCQPPSNFCDDAQRVINEMRVANISDSVVAALTRRARSPVHLSEQTLNVVVGHIGIALDAAATTLRSSGLDSRVVRKDVCGDANDVGVAVAQLLRCVADGRPVDERAEWLLVGRVPYERHCNRLALLWGGETTVRVVGGGRGGRNQQTALAFLVAAADLRLDDAALDFAFMSAGTDGQDGPTDAAGAIVTKRSVGALSQRANRSFAQECLADNNSYEFFNRFLDGDCHIKTGLTGTNVMDLLVLLIL